MESQLPWIASIQQYTALTKLMEGLTFLGNEEFFLLLMPLVYLCIDARLGLRLGFIVLFGDALNAIFKIVLHQPRPYWLQPSLQVGTHADVTYGLPSSHAQNGAAVWLFLAFAVRRPWAWGAAALLITLIGFSRVYLGLHFPTDVLGGWILGIAFLLTFLRIEPTVRHWFISLSVNAQVTTIALGTALLILAGIVAQAAISGIVDPAAWAEHSDKPRELKPLISRAGGLFGLGIGAIMMQRLARFDAGGPVALRLARFLIGVSVLIALYVGLSRVKFSTNDADATNLVMRFIRYTLMTWWVVFLAPWLFLRMGLAKPSRSTNPI